MIDNASDICSRSPRTWAMDSLRILLGINSTLAYHYSFRSTRHHRKHDLAQYPAPRRYGNSTTQKDSAYPFHTSADTTTPTSLSTPHLSAMPRDRSLRHSRRRSNGSGAGNGHGGHASSSSSSSRLLGHTEPHCTVDSAEGFWRELEAIVTLSEVQHLSVLDNSIRMFVTFCGAYHDQYLRDENERYASVCILLESDLFQSGYNERMVGVMMSDAQENTNPHEQYIWYHIILEYGRRHTSLFRSHRKWQKLLPTLGEVVDLEYDDGFVMGVYPIEGRLRLPAVKLMYEVCRVQKLDERELAQFDDSFIDHLFDLVESTRNQQDEVLNYAVIKLIVALNEQFMVQTLPKRESRHRGSSASATALTADGENEDHKRRRAHSVSPAPKPGCEEHVVEDTKRHNRVLVVLMRRLGNSPTFASSVVFMLNRAEDTSEGLCLQLLILKILYLLFTTPGTREYFYTNDLRVLLDVFIRELVDLDDEHEALRHTYLRVLYPLLCHSQLRNDSYKRPQIRLVLQSLVSQAHIRDIDSTMKRLVERCLTAAQDYRSASDPSPSRPNLNGNSLSPDSAMCLGSVAEALPCRTLFTGGDPIRVASLIDVSGALEQPDRPPSVASNADSPVDRSSNSTPVGKSKPLHRRRAPAPPKRKHSAASTNSVLSLNSDDESVATPGLSSGDLVTIGERGVPPPIIEVQTAPSEWIKFSA